MKIIQFYSILFNRVLSGDGVRQLLLLLREAPNGGAPGLDRLGGPGENYEFEVEGNHLERLLACLPTLFYVNVRKV